MPLIFRKLKVVTFFFFLLPNLNLFSHAHMMGVYSSEEEAKKKSLELACVGIHKNKGKWLPCENEEELHRYLRK